MPQLFGDNPDMTEVVDNFKLYQNYPNPFNPETNIRFALKKSEHVKLEIYNVLGQKIRTLLNKKYSTGVHSITWDSKDNTGKLMSSGIYLYRLSAGKHVQIRKMLLLK